MPELDWSRSMSQTYDFYLVDTDTWMDLQRIDCVTKCTIDWDYSSNTVGSAKVTCTENFGEWYIRAYLIAKQDGVEYRRAMGTFLILTPEDNFDGKISSWDLDAYSPLIELTETYPPLGYCIPKNTNVLQIASQLCSEHMRAPVITPDFGTDILYEDFVASPDETWLEFLSSLVAHANHKIMVDEYGQCVFMPIRRTGSLAPTMTYTTDNSSMLLPAVRQTRDLYSIPNKVDVIFSTSNKYLVSTAINDNPTSPTSVSARGRYIEIRETSPNLSGNPTQSQLDKYAETLLKEASTLEYTVTYTHGYCDTAIGEGVMLRYPEVGLNGVKAKIILQSIDLVPGCLVQETAIYTSALY